MSTALAVGCVIAIWTALAILLCGIGVLVAAAAGAPPRRSASIYLWLGWCAALAYLQLSHLIKPVDAFDQMVLAGVGAAGLWHARHALRPRALTLGDAAAAALIVAVAVYAARHALVPPRNYDSGTYHVPTVIWFNRFRIVPGLANLHVRLAFGSSSLLFAALLNAGWLAGFAVNLTLGFFVVSIAATLAWNGMRRAAWTANAPLAAGALVTLPLVGAQIYAVAFEGLSTDTVIYCCAIELAVLMLSLAAADESSDARTLDWLAIVVLAAAGATVKPSFLVFGLAAATWAAFIARPLPLRTRAIASSFAAVAVAGWIARSIVLSGYPLFPIPMFPLRVPWRVPLETVRELFGWIRAWARLIDDDSMRVPFDAILSGWSWFSPWLASFVRRRWDVLIPAAIVAGAGVVAVASRARIGGRPQRYAAALAVPAAALASWFVSAPDVRFAAGFIATVPMLVWAAVAATPGDRRGRVRILASAAAVGAIVGAAQAKTMIKWWCVWPASIRLAELPVPAARTVVTASGLALRVPIADETCWAAELPCTPYPNAALRLDRADDAGSGFRIAPFDDGAIAGWWTR